MRGGRFNTEYGAMERGRSSSQLVRRTAPLQSKPAQTCCLLSFCHVIKKKSKHLMKLRIFCVSIVCYELDKKNNERRTFLSTIHLYSRLFSFENYSLIYKALGYHRDKLSNESLLSACSSCWIIFACSLACAAAAICLLRIDCCALRRLQVKWKIKIKI